MWGYKHTHAPTGIDLNSCPKSTSAHRTSQRCLTRATGTARVSGARRPTRLQRAAQQPLCAAGVPLSSHCVPHVQCVPHEHASTWCQQTPSRLAAGPATRPGACASTQWCGRWCAAAGQQPQPSGHQPNGASGGYTRHQRSNSAALKHGHEEAVRAVRVRVCSRELLRPRTALDRHAASVPAWQRMRQVEPCCLRVAQHRRDHVLVLALVGAAGGVHEAPQPREPECVAQRRLL